MAYASSRSGSPPSLGRSPPPNPVLDAQLCREFHLQLGDLELLSTTLELANDHPDLAVGHKLRWAAEPTSVAELLGVDIVTPVVPVVHHLVAVDDALRPHWFRDLPAEAGYFLRRPNQVSSKVSMDRPIQLGYAGAGRMYRAENLPFFAGGSGTRTVRPAVVEVDVVSAHNAAERYTKPDLVVDVGDLVDLVDEQAPEFLKDLGGRIPLLESQRLAGRFGEDLAPRLLGQRARSLAAEPLSKSEIVAELQWIGTRELTPEDRPVRRRTYLPSGNQR